MLTGLELMLKRMETHPEEFVGANGGCSREWHIIISPVIDNLTGEEKKALEQGMRQAHRDHFNGQVLRKLAGEQVLDDEDYYGGPSFSERLKANGNYSLYESQSAKSAQAATMPSAFGAVPTVKQQQYNILGAKEKYE